MKQFPPALLALADGTVFRGQGIGAEGTSAGEVVFNTAMSGYQEILTDPSYCRQIVTLTYPHIGNTGINREDCEADKVYAAGLVIRDLPLVASNWRSEQTLDAYLKAQGVVAIAGIDTRKLTRILREKGAQGGCLVSGENLDEAAAVARAQAFPGLSGMDLAKVVSVDQPYAWNEGEWQLGKGYAAAPEAKFHVVAYDFGVKRNILRMLASRGCRLTVVPAQTPADEALALKPDGIFLSNGPGDPEPCSYAVAAIREFLARGIPTFGICLGHQLLALASGAATVKMKFGHHGANHPVKDLDTGRVAITSQNHGFAVDAQSLPDCLRPTHVSLFDGSLQGLARTDVPAFCFQGHPEASPELCTYVLGTIFIVLLPGPNSLYVLSVASRRGVRQGYLGACGIFLGDSVLMLLSATGVASLLRANPVLFMIAKFAGAAYLAWIGAGLLKSAWAGRQDSSTTAEAALPEKDAAKDTSRPFHSALMISLVNPKAILFFISFFIQFVDPGYPYPVLSFLVLGLICQIISATYLSVLIFGGARLAEQFRKRRKLASAATGGVGALFIGFGAKLASATLS